MSSRHSRRPGRAGAMMMPRAFMALLILSVMAAMPAAGGPDVSSELLGKVPEPVPAPDFILKDIDGNTHRLADYRGKVVIVNFWATWCPPCREEMPALQRAWQQVHDEDIVILAVDIGETEDEIFLFTGDYPVDFPLLMDSDSSVIRQWPVRGLPTTFVLDPQGRVVYRAIGGRAWDSAAILDRVRALRVSPGSSR